MFCTTCGSQAADGTRFCPNCGATFESAPPPPPTPAYAAPAGYGPVAAAAAYAAAPQWPAAVKYAGFWRRFWAYLIDSVVFGVVAVAVFVAFGALGLGVVSTGSPDAIATGVFALLALLIPLALVGGWLYFAGLEGSERQATIGKMAVGIKVTDLSGSRISFGHATGRYFSKLITGLIPFGIGYMLAGWTEKKQALHDMIASTLVVCR